MSKTFPSYDALTSEIMYAITDAVRGAQIGVSSRSVSRYVEVNIEDEDGDIIGERRVRISDHEARASCGGNIVFEVDIRDFNIDEIEDEGEFDHIVVNNDWMISEAIEAAVKALS